MSNIRQRSIKASELTQAEMDANFKKGVTAKAADYTITKSDNEDTIEFTGTSLTCTLPAVSTITNTTTGSETGEFGVTIKNLDTTVLTITPNGTDTIDGTNTSIALGQYGSVTLQSNNAASGWNKIGITSKVILTSATASAVNEVTVTNAATGNSPKIESTGVDTDINFEISAKGKGCVVISDHSAVIAGTASSIISIGSLNFPSDRVIEANAYLIGVTSSAILHLVLNSDTTITNYYRVYISDGTASPKDNTPILAGADPSDELAINILLYPSSTTGKTTIVTNIGSWDSSASEMIRISGSVIYTASGVITSIGIRNSGGFNTLDVGSTLRVKLK